MPVSFGAVDLVPPASPPPASGAPPATSATSAPPPRLAPRDVAPVLHQLHLRANRVRAH